MIHQNNAAIAQAYYTAIAERNIVELEKYLDANILFIAPLAKVTGKQDFVETLKRFVTFFTALTIRSTFGNEHQAMVAYTLEFPGSIGKVETAALLHIENNLITKIELYYDARPFEKNN